LKIDRIKVFAKTEFLRYLLLAISFAILGWAVSLYPNQILIFSIPLFFLLFLAMSLKELFLLVLIAFPFSVEIIPFHLNFALLFPTEILIILVIVKWFVDSMVTEKKFILKDKFDRPVIFFLVAIFLSLIINVNTQNIFVSLKGFLRYIAYILFGWKISQQLIINKKDLGRVVQVLIIPSIILSVYGLYRITIFHFNPNLFGFGIAIPFFYNRGPYAAYLSFMVFLTGSMCVYKQKFNILFLISSFLSFSVILISQTRGAWAGLLIAIVFLLFFFRKEVSLKKLTPPIVLSLLLFSLYVLQTPNGESHIRKLLSIKIFVQNAWKIRSVSQVSQTFGSSISERINRWVAAFNMFKAHPFLGVGFENYEKAYFYYRDLSLYVGRSTEMVMGAHSEYLTMLAESGIFALSAFIFIIYKVVRIGLFLSRRLKDYFLKQAATGITLGYITYIVHGLVNNFLSLDKIAIPFWLSMGLLISIRRLDREEDEE